MEALGQFLLTIALISLVSGLAFTFPRLSAFPASVIYAGLACAAWWFSGRSSSTAAWLATAGVLGLPIGLYLAGAGRVLADDPLSDATLRDEVLHGLIGRSGRTLTPLRPSGYVELDGRPRHALVEGGAHLAPGVMVVAVQVRGVYLLVRAAADDPGTGAGPRAREHQAD